MAVKLLSPGLFPGRDMHRIEPAEIELVQLVRQFVVKVDQIWSAQLLENFDPQPRPAKIPFSPPGILKWKTTAELKKFFALSDTVVVRCPATLLPSHKIKLLVQLAPCGFEEVKLAKWIKID